MGAGDGGGVVCEIEGVGGGRFGWVGGCGVFGILLVAFFEGVGDCGEGAVGDGLEGWEWGLVDGGAAEGR